MARAFPRDYRRPSQMRVDKHAPSLYLSTAKTIDPLDGMSLYTFLSYQSFLNRTARHNQIAFAFDAGF
jgi:hypothetical protein